MARGQDPKMQLSSPYSSYARKGTPDNSYFLRLALSQEESIGYTPSDQTPHLISTRPPKATNGISHSLLYNISAENYTPVMLCVCLAEELLAILDFIFFPVTTQNYRSLYKIMRKSLSPPSLPLLTAAAAGNGCR